MKSKTHPIKNTNSSLLRTSIAVATVGLLTIGVSACGDNDAISDNQTRMEEPMVNSQNNPPNSTTDSTPNAMGDTKLDTTQDTSSDTWITAKVKTELLADDISKGFDIEVTTVDGVVSLDGKVKNAEAVMHIQQIARNVEGVLQVDTSGLMQEEAKAY